jgi:hypothetical protein
MPDEIGAEELMYQLPVLEKIDEGGRDIEAGNVIAPEELVRRSDVWLRGSGPPQQSAAPNSA